MASPMSEFLGVVVLSIILWFGGQLVLNHSVGALKPEAFITYILFFTQIINPAKSLSTSFYNAQRGSSAIKRIEEVLQAPVVIEEAANPVPFPSFNHGIEFRNVSFGYDDITILDNINLSIEKGKNHRAGGLFGSRQVHPGRPGAAVSRRERR